MDSIGIDGAWIFTPRIYPDNRGNFHEWFRGAEFLDDLGYRFELAQANCSVSHRGVIRGVHFTEVPPGQAKYVACGSGAVLDVVVDVRVGSPTYGRWEAVQLDDQTRRAVFICEGLGHAFMALSPQATVMYLCSTPYAPGIEHGVHPLDPALGIAWPKDVPGILSEKDAAAPTLDEARRTGLLPGYQDCLAFAARLREPAADRRHRADAAPRQAADPSG
jgi:dTDP-4-dehydrorhamnose 3,5-epimerase